MFCTNCGTENKDTAKFCRNCGEKLNGYGVVKEDTQATVIADDYENQNYDGLNYDGQNYGAYNYDGVQGATPDIEYEPRQEEKKGIAKKTIILVSVLSALVVVLIVVLGIVLYKNVFSEKDTVVIEETKGEESSSGGALDDQKPGTTGNVIVEADEEESEEASKKDSETAPTIDKEVTPTPVEKKLEQPYKVSRVSLDKVEPVTGSDEPQAKYIYSYTVNGMEFIGEFTDYDYSAICGISVSPNEVGDFYIYDVDKDGNDEIIFHILYLGNTLAETAGGLSIMAVTEDGPEEILAEADDIAGLRDDWVTDVITSEDELQIEVGTKDCNREFIGYVSEVYSIKYEKGRWTSMIVSSSLDEYREAFKAYADYIEQSDFPRGVGILVFNADEDYIPEIMLRGTCEADGNVILSYKKGQVYDWYTDRLGVGYLPYKGYFINSDGHMGYYYDIIERLTDNGFETVGTYTYTEDISSYDEDGEFSYNYYWNDEECTQEEADRKFAEAFPYDRTDVVEIGYSESKSYGDYNTIEEAYLDIIGERMR